MDLRYSYVDGRKASDFVDHNGTEARLVQYPDGSTAWLDRSGVPLIETPVDDAQKEDGQGGEGNEGIQAGNPTYRQAGARKRSKSQKPEAGDIDRVE